MPTTRSTRRLPAHCTPCALAWLALTPVAAAQSTNGSVGPTALPPFVEIASGSLHTCARTAAGEVWCWGSNRAGELGDGSLVDRATPVHVAGVSDATQIAAAHEVTCALRRDRTVWCWGNVRDGAPNPGGALFTPTPRPLRGLDDVLQVALDTDTGCAVRGDGTVWCWGDSVRGERANGSTYAPAGQQQFPPVPTRVEGIAHAVRVRFTSAGTYAVTTDGAVHGWGIGNAAQFPGGALYAGVGRPLFDAGLRSVATRVPSLSQAVDVHVSGWHVCSLDAAHTLRCSDRPVAAGAPGDAHPPPPDAVQTGATADVAQVSPRCLLGGDGTLRCLSQPADPHTPARPTVVEGLPPVVSFAEGLSSRCALARDGGVWCWGSNLRGQLGDGQAMARSSPVAVPGVTSAAQVSAGSTRTCVVDTQGTVRCAGYGADPVIAAAFGTTTQEGLRSFGAARGLTDVARVAAGGDLVCALRHDGSVACAGHTVQGTVRQPWVTARTPDGARFTGATGLQIEGAALFVQRPDGVWRWFESSHATPLVLTRWPARGTPRDGAHHAVWITQDGAGHVEASVAHPALSLPDTVSLADAGAHDFGCAVGVTGAVSCWGANGHGQRGVGSVAPVANVTRVAGNLAAQRVGVGDGFACALARDATAWCWGRNDEGQLGDGTTTDRPLPTQVPGLRGVAELSVGDAHACARRGDGTVVCWGSDRFGELGTASVETRAEPRRVVAVGASGHGCTAVAAGTARSDKESCAKAPPVRPPWGADGRQGLTA